VTPHFYPSQYTRRPIEPPPLIPLDVMVERIEAARLESAPECCPTCTSTVTQTTKRCGACGALKALTEFSRDRSSPTGRHSQCSACKARNHRQYRVRLAKRSIPRLEVAS
jgi:hypothetical protein